MDKSIIPRMFSWVIVTLLLIVLLHFASPQQMDVVMYKLLLVCLGAVIGYWLDRSLFPYSRPDGYLKRHWLLGTDEPENAADFEVVAGYFHIFALAMLRRAIIMAAVVIGMTLGL